MALGEGIFKPLGTPVLTFLKRGPGGIFRAQKRPLPKGIFSGAKGVSVWLTLNGRPRNMRAPLFGEEKSWLVCSFS